MDRQSRYYRQVQLLLRLIPFIARHPCFALKGGTAINLFLRNFPRLSVDIDLVFLPDMQRREALKSIKRHLEMLATAIMASNDAVEVTPSFREKNDALRLLVEQNGVQVKIELSPVLRGTVYPPALKQVSEAVEEEFGFAEMLVVDFADLFAGKICAALDRQHPRDLFDVMQLLDNEGLTYVLRKALIVYIISHPRPVAELLRPRFKYIAKLYDGEFRNMSELNVSLSSLEEARERLVEIINSSLTHDERMFLLTFKNRDPDWSPLGLSGVDKLPAVRWKLQNLAKMQEAKHTAARQQLKEILFN